MNQINDDMEVDDVIVDMNQQGEELPEFEEGNEEFAENFSIGSMHHGKAVFAVHYHQGIFYSGGEDDKVVAWKDEQIWERTFNDSVVAIQSSGTEMDSRVGVASMDGDIAIIENKNGIIREMFALSGPSEIVCLYMKKKIVVAGSQDGLIWIWKNQDVLNVLSGHSASVTDVKAINNTLVSISEDGNIITWDPIQNQILFKIESAGYAHEVPIVSLCLYNGTITGDVSGKILLSNNGKVLETIGLHDQSVESISISNNIVVSSDVSGKVVFWDYNTKRARNLAQIESVVTCTQVEGNFAYVGCQDGKILKFDILTGENVFVYEGNTEQILCLLVIADYVISGSDGDGSCLVFFKDHKKYNELD
eukprot:NODE_273_length_11040_cov_1.244036.p4 type:complete len:363 gc:universal NODE_273_length_11040_cov_1.244036:881-1969(+)